MSDPFIGQLSMFGFNYAPRNWSLCYGTVMAISDNNALFSIIGTTYGGNGQTTFALPDMRGRVPMGQGQGRALTPRSTGQRLGTETVTLTSDQIAAHTHEVSATTATADSVDPQNRLYAETSAPPNRYKTNPSLTTFMGTDTVQEAGGVHGSTLPHANMAPVLGINWSICAQGTYPQRS